MLRATSPRNRWLKRLAVVPPGDAASSIMPMPSSGGRSKSDHQAEADQRQQHELAAERDQHRLRVLAPTRLKSATVRPSPSPNMMIASAIGSPTVVSAESMAGL